MFSSWYHSSVVCLGISCCGEAVSLVFAVLAEVGFDLNQVVVKFVDFGDCTVLPVDDIRLLPTRFQQLPCLAVNVKLGGASVS